MAEGVRCKILVAYVTRSGFTRTVAQRIATVLRLRGHEVDVADLELCIRHPETYDAVILGSGVRLGHHAQIVADFITEHRAVLAGRPCAFFSVDRNAYKTVASDPKHHMNELFEKVNWHPRHALAVAGKLDYREHALPRRLAMRVHSRLDHAPTDTSRDHVLTDWRRVKAFADQFAQECGSPS
jgi:menaquinone-dependent protoporphyrinogen oxidase